MAVTVNQQPAAFTPAFAPMIFEATSTQIAAANFTYTIIVTDLITSATETYPHEQRPVTGECVFDARDFVKDFIKHYIPYNLYGFQKCTDAIRKIRVNIGETYGTTPTYYAGSNIDFIVWNGGMSWLEYPVYNYNDYVYNSFTTNYAYLNRVVTHTTFENKSLFFYLLSTGAGDFSSLRVETFNAAGASLGFSYIANPHVASATYTDKYLCLDVGHKGLSGIAALDVTGVYPIITASVASYQITDLDTSAVLMNVTIGCEAKHDLFTLHYLDKYGNFQTLNFPKFSEIITKNSKTTYKQQPFALSSNTWVYSRFTAHEKVLNTQEDNAYRITTDWLTENEADVFAHIIHSAVVYIDLGTTIGLVPVMVDTNSLQRPKKWNAPKMRAIQIDIRYTFKENWQND